MKIIKGIDASPGIVVGKVFLCNDEKLVIPKYNIEENKADTELTRFQIALTKSRRELGKIRDNSKANDTGLNKPNAALINSQLMMLEDTFFIEEIEKTIRKEKRNIEWVVIQVIEKMIDKLNASKDPYLMERSLDFHDISKRLINHLLLYKRSSLANIKQNIILVAHTLMPSDTIMLNREKVLGIATDAGGKTSHTAILARSFEIPAVLGLGNVSQQVQSGDEIILDGNQGLVIVGPDPDTQAKYIKQKNEMAQLQLIFNEQLDLPAVTKDGKHISLKANIEVPEELEAVLKHKADGIGLFRSEFLYLQKDSHPQEEEQFQIYKYVLERMESRPVIIRTIDLGGDKIIGGYPDSMEDNPILGWRAIRFCLSRPEVFKVQLRALFRASVFGNLKIMFPFVSGADEVDQLLAIVKQVKEELKAKGLPFKSRVPLGIMIEIPSAALTSDDLAQKADFFSIGTNDLIQYTLAVDRGNERINNLYDPFHPALLRLIQTVIDNAHAYKIPVGMCGEMAADPLATVILIGMGLDHFSMSASSIPRIKNIIRSLDSKEACELVQSIRQISSSLKINRILKEWIDEKIGNSAY